MRAHYASAANFTSGHDWNTRTAKAKWLYYEPTSTRVRRSCAAVWMESGRVRWYSPLLSFFDDILDPQPFILLFPCAGGHVEPFERAMEWLDSICCVATSIEEVEEKISRKPEWGLHWLSEQEKSKGLPRLRLETATPLAKEFTAASMRDCVTCSIQRIVTHHPHLQGCRIEKASDKVHVRNIGELELKTGHRILITAIHELHSQDVIRQGILALDHLRGNDDRCQHALLIVPSCTITGVIQLSTKLTICVVDFGVLLQTLVDISNKFEALNA